MKPEVTQLQTATRAAWEQEFAELGVIPSSRSFVPSRSLRMLLALLPINRRLRVLDIGCGNGRNAVYMAALGHSVVGVDYCTAAISLAKAESCKSVFAGDLHFRQQALETVDVENDGFDLVLDSYVSCHFLEIEKRESFKQLIWLLLRKSRGFFVTFSPTAEDEYYGDKIVAETALGAISLDPANNIPKLLLDERALRGQYDAHFQSVLSGTLRYDDVVMSTKYTKSTAFLLAECQGK